MRLASYCHSGVESYGVIIGERLVDLGGRLRDRFADLRAVLEADALGEISAVVSGAEPDLSVHDIAFLPVIGKPDKIVCSGVNYHQHGAESGVEPPSDPILFLRLANTLVGHEQPLIRPPVSDQLDWEGELAVVIGRAGRYIPEVAALSHIAGYACFLDASVRDFQQHSIAAGKNFLATGGFGPWMTTADEISDPAGLTLSTRLNGRTVQHGSTAEMIFGIPRLISYVSTITPLVPGDVIVTGTPSGVGAAREPPLWMKPGDRIDVEISGIGVLGHPIADEAG